MSGNGYILLRIDPFIWCDTSLNYPEKIILNFIFSWTIQDKCCLATDEWLAYKFGWEPDFVNQVITLLEQRGWIKITPADWQHPRRMSIYIPGNECPCQEFTDVTAIDV